MRHEYVDEDMAAINLKNELRKRFEEEIDKMKVEDLRLIKRERAVLRSWLTNIFYKVKSILSIIPPERVVARILDKFLQKFH